jgi:rhodanese-related sulfurtransferase
LRLLETAPEKPVILDVRDTGAYAKSPVRIADSVHITPEELQAGTPSVRIEPTRTVVAYCT